MGLVARALLLPRVIFRRERQGAWVDAYDGGDSSPLHYAAQFASPDAVRALLQGGAKLDLKNRR
jgi:ankyrin repeat protein